MKKVKLHIQVSKASPNENIYYVREGAALLIKDGWKMKSRTWSNWILVPPAGIRHPDAIIETVVPEISEVMELANKIHKTGLPWRGRAFGWNAEYSQSQDRNMGGKPSRIVNFPAYFFIGELGLWMISLRWEDGDNNPPRVISDTSCIVHEPPVEARTSNYAKKYI